MSRSAFGRGRARLWTLTVIGATLAGCTTAGASGAGAPTPTPAGPTVIGGQTLPPLIERPTSSAEVSPSVQRDAQSLSVRIDAALAAEGTATPATRLVIDKAAGNQIQVNWVLGTTWPDPTARDRVRKNVITILDLVSMSSLHYGSVLLLATGASVNSDGAKKISVVVRAKYTHPLVVRTDWTAVSPAAVLGMCDDKPAEIAAGYR